jgi:hypothetical protein
MWYIVCQQVHLRPLVCTTIVPIQYCHCSYMQHDDVFLLFIYEKVASFEIYNSLRSLTFDIFPIKHYGTKGIERSYLLYALS